MNKTTAGNSLMSLNKSNTPLPKEALSASNMSFSSRAPAQSVQTDIQPALHASQSNNTDNNQTLDLRLGHGLPTANLAESNDQMKFKQNGEFFLLPFLKKELLSFYFIFKFNLIKS